MEEYWYDADADIMYYSCLTLSEYWQLIIITLLVWEFIKYLYRRLQYYVKI
tara:strand:- start:2918 stop:3070 length:153 start_codon:yes stop_codon:yes gene_type:complete